MSKVYVEIRTRFVLNTLHDVDKDEIDAMVDQLSDQIDQIGEVDGAFVTVTDSQSFLQDVK